MFLYGILYIYNLYIRITCVHGTHITKLIYYIKSLPYKLRTCLKLWSADHEHLLHEATLPSLNLGVVIFIRLSTKALTILMHL